MLKNLENRNGITIVSLVVTIIILIILAGVTINMTLGDNGILSIAKRAKENMELAQINEGTRLNELYAHMGEDGTWGELDYDAIAKLDEFKSAIADAITQKGVETLPNDSLDTMVENIGKIEGGSSSQDKLSPQALALNVELGDYVAYDPSSGNVPSSMLTYTSPIGSGTSHGNGYAEQTFTASSSNKYWHVVKKDESTGEVVIRADVSPDKGTYTYFQGPIGYLYGEQELSEICKIYGYGKGADTSRSVTYQTGGIFDTISHGTITGSGARCCSIADLEDVLGISFTWDSGNATSSTYYYPTKTTSTGWSTNTVASLPWSRIDFSTSEFKNVEGYNLWFSNAGYWLVGGRMQYEESSSVYCGLALQGYTSIGSVQLARCSNISQVGLDRNSSQAVRVLVHLKPSVTTTGKDADGKWIIIDE